MYLICTEGGKKPPLLGSICSPVVSGGEDVTLWPHLIQTLVIVKCESDVPGLSSLLVHRIVELSVPAISRPKTSKYKLL